MHSMYNVEILQAVDCEWLQVDGLKYVFRYLFLCKNSLKLEGACML